MPAGICGWRLLGLSGGLPDGSLLSSASVGLSLVDISNLTSCPLVGGFEGSCSEAFNFESFNPCEDRSLRPKAY